MSYSIPKTWAYKETLSSSDLNTYVRDNVIDHESRIVDTEVIVIPASASAPASLDLAEDTDNGTNKITIIAPSAIDSDKVITLPDFAGMVVLFETMQLPEGSLLNGKIVVTVTSNNITLALKGADGNDPSASNPVYCKIGGVIRSVTAALSVTKNAATNWCNAGSAELATKEIDYFAYLGYNATDGVVLGFSRIPYACQYSDFSTTTTNEKYCAISTITNAAATDYYNVIGRFAATLSAGAGYTWSVPTFTAINLIQRPIYETRWLAIARTFDVTTIDNGSGGQPTTVESRYKISGSTLSWHLNISGTKATTDARIIFSLGGLFTPLNTSNHSCFGNAFCYAAASFIGTIQFFETNLAIYLNANVADNTTITGAGANGSYEI
jgi:hypothetical protein